MENKTHYRKVFKSDHLGSADLEEMIEDKKILIFTIAHVTQHIIDPMVKGSGVNVAGRKVSANIAHFREDIKPMVLNATNSKVIKSFAPNKSPFVDDWVNIRIELYIDYNVKLMKEIVGGVRIRPVQPKAKVKPVFTETNFEKALAANATIEMIAKTYTITPEVAAKYEAHGTT